LDSELREAEEIFGPGFDLDMFKKVTAPQPTEEDEEMELDQEEDRESDGSGSYAEGRRTYVDISVCSVVLYICNILKLSTCGFYFVEFLNENQQRSQKHELLNFLSLRS